MFFFVTLLLSLCYFFCFFFIFLFFFRLFLFYFFFCFSSRRRRTRCALVTGVQTVCSSDLRQRPLGAKEAALQPVRAALRKRRMFGARDELKGQLARQLAPKAEHRLVPILLHPARSLGIGDFGEIVRRGVERIKARDIVQRVERGFRRQLPVAAQHLPLIFAAPDGLADVAGLGEAVAGRRRSVGGAQHHFLRHRLVAETAQDRKSVG